MGCCSKVKLPDESVDFVAYLAPQFPLHRWSVPVPVQQSVVTISGEPVAVSISPSVMVSNPGHPQHTISPGSSDITLHCRLHV